MMDDSMPAREVTMIEDLTVEDAMTDEGYRSLTSLAEGASRVIDGMVVELEQGKLRLRGRICQHCKSLDEVEDVFWGIIDIMCRELVYGWNLIEDIGIAMLDARQETIARVCAEMRYVSEQRVVRVSVRKHGRKIATVYEYEV